MITDQLLSIQWPSAFRRQLPFATAVSGQSGATYIPPRRRQHARHLSSGRIRTVTKEVVCVLGYRGPTYPVPRGKQREKLQSLGLIGRMIVCSNWDEEDMRRQTSALFRTTFQLTMDEMLVYKYLQVLAYTVNKVGCYVYKITKLHISLHLIRAPTGFFNSLHSLSRPSLPRVNFWPEVSFVR